MKRRRISRRTAAKVEKLYQAEYSTLFLHARLLTQDDGYAAEDLVHETFAAVVYKFSKFPRDPDERRAWLFTVLKRRAIDRWRRESRETPQPELLDTESMPSGDEIDLLAEFGVDGETIDRLWKEMRAMPPAQYRVVYLEWVCGLPTREIAENLGISQSTVRVHRRNAVRKLRQILSPSSGLTRPETDRGRPGQETGGGMVS